MDQSARIKAEAHRRGVACLFHFTRIENLRAIAHVGLVPRGMLQDAGIDHVASDGMRLDDPMLTRGGPVCLSVSDVYEAMFAAKRSRDPEARWIVLGIEPSVLWTHRCEFYASNAASAGMTKGQSRRWLAWYFADMFRGTDLRDPMPTDVGAEVQVSGVVDPRLIRGVWTDRPGAAREVARILDGSPAGRASIHVSQFRSLRQV